MRCTICVGRSNKTIRHYAKLYSLKMHDLFDYSHQTHLLNPAFKDTATVCTLPYTYKKQLNSLFCALELDWIALLDVIRYGYDRVVLKVVRYEL